MSEPSTGVDSTDVVVEPAAGLAGEPDGFGRMWTPHRMAYINGQGKPADASDEVCPFDRIVGLPDDEALIIARGNLVYAVMNLYPYNAGHLMVVPYRHVPHYTDLTPEEISEFGRFTQIAMHTLTAVSAPHGFNIGMNQGAIAGAGIAAHLHQHVVPRWGGDTNFIPIVAQTRVLPQLLGDVRAALAAEWPTVARTAVPC